MSIKSKKRRAVVQRAMRSAFTKSQIAAGEVCKRQAKRWLGGHFDNGQMESY